MNATDAHAIHSSSESNWRTPDPLFEALKQEFHFLVDAAATLEDSKCPYYFGPDHQIETQRDALAIDWHQYARLHTEGCGEVECPFFLNPPFSRELVNAYNTGRIKDHQTGQWIAHEKNLDKARAYDIANWARKCWEESRRGCTIAAVMPFAPQTEWYRQYVYGHGDYDRLPGKARPEIVGGWNGHAAQQERRFPHRIGFLRPDGTPAGNAGVNSAIIVWSPMRGVVGPWQPHSFYWTYRGAA